MPSRRTFTQLITTGVAGALAGCSSGNGTEQTGQPSESAEATGTPSDGSEQSIEEITHSAKLAAEDGESGDSFGSSVSLSADGDRVIVGADFWEGSGEFPENIRHGQAYVFDREGDTWTQQAGFGSEDNGERDRFGRTVALTSDGSTAFVGAPGEGAPNGDSSGAVYVFSVTDGTWSEQAKLVPDDGDADDEFGSEVSAASDGSAVLIGAAQDEDPSRKNGGSAYLFGRSGETWSQQAKLTPDDGGEGWSFGADVALSADGSTGVVGAPGANEPGAAYVFSKSGDSWTQTSKLVSEDSANRDQFGGAVSVAADGQTALVTARWDINENGNSAGSAYLFSNTDGEWRQQTRLLPADGDGRDFYGTAAALSDDGSQAVVTAEFDEDPNGPDSGSAYRFSSEGGTWTQQAKLYAGDGDESDGFGSAVSVTPDGETAIVGALNDEDPNGTDENSQAGSAYVFDFESN